MAGSSEGKRPFRFSIDRGGTFTDVYAEVPGSKGFRVLKLLSEDPHNYPDAPREGVRRILEVRTCLNCRCVGCDVQLCLVQDGLFAFFVPFFGCPTSVLLCVGRSSG